MTPTSAHLIALSHMLAMDPEAGTLNTRDLQIVALLVAHKHKLPVGQIAEMLKISSSHCSRLTDRLVERGFLARSAHHADRRIVLLQPTKAGRALDTRVSRAYWSAADATAAA